MWSPKCGWFSGLLAGVELLGLDDSPTFLDDDQLVDLDIGEGFLSTRGPADCDQINLAGLPEAKVKAEIVIRDVACAAHNLVDLGVASGHHLYSGPNGAPV